MNLLLYSPLLSLLPSLSQAYLKRQCTRLGVRGLELHSVGLCGGFGVDLRVKREVVGGNKTPR